MGFQSSLVPRRHLVSVSGPTILLLLLLPKCPACWGAYGALIGVFGGGLGVLALPETSDEMFYLKLSLLFVLAGGALLLDFKVYRQRRVQVLLLGVLLNMAGTYLWEIEFLKWIGIIIVILATLSGLFRLLSTRGAEFARALNLKTMGENNVRSHTSRS